jgi:hypothetical protein
VVEAMMELAELLNPIIQWEMATIGAIDTAVPLENNPDYVMLFHFTKEGKQANIAQMTAMLRAAGAQPVMKANPGELMLKLQTGVLERLGTTPALRAFRLTQREIVDQYAEVYGRLGGFFDSGIEKAWHRAIKQWIVLSAHVAKRGGLELEELSALPQPLDRYFAHDEARACMRCLLDRPGKRPPIERGDPNPYQYLCAACHEEVLSDFAFDILEKAERWTPHDLQSHVLERAIGKPSKLKAEKLVLAKMSGLAPDLPPPPIPRKAAMEVARAEHARLQPRAEVRIEPPAGMDERLYTELLFDYESVRDNW